MEAAAVAAAVALLESVPRRRAWLAWLMVRRALEAPPFAARAAWTASNLFPWLSDSPSRERIERTEQMLSVT